MANTKAARRAPVESEAALLRETEVVSVGGSGVCCHCPLWVLDCHQPTQAHAQVRNHEEVTKASMRTDAQVCRCRPVRASTNTHFSL